MNGILVVNKPADCTSRDIVNKLNKIFKTKKMTLRISVKIRHKKIINSTEKNRLIFLAISLL